MAVAVSWTIQKNVVGSDFEIYTRAKINGRIIHSKEYRRLQKRENHFVQTVENVHGEVEMFIKQGEEFFAILNTKRKVRSKNIYNREESAQLDFLVPVESMENEYVVINIKNIKAICLKIDCNNITYLCTKCNPFQVDL